MKLLFRQGIVRHQVDVAGTATFIRKNGQDSSFVDEICDNGPIQFTIAHFASDYLFEELKTVYKAWGPIPNNTTAFLYWDVSLLNASITHGFTLYPPFTSVNPPANPAVDQHWFDTGNSAMKVWNGHVWTVKLRVFAGLYDHNAILTPKQNGSQIGVNGNFSAGYVILGKNSYPLRDSDGTFVTTESNLIVANNSSEDVKFEAALQFAQAAEFIPAFSLVSYETPGIVSLASFMNTDIQVNGLIRQDAWTGEVVKVFSHGVISNTDWDWTGNIGKPLFCGLNGEITLTPPPDGVSQMIGYVYDIQTIFVSILSPILLN